MEGSLYPYKIGEQRKLSARIKQRQTRASRECLRARVRSSVQNVQVPFWWMPLAVFVEGFGFGQHPAKPSGEYNSA